MSCLQRALAIIGLCAVAAPALAQLPQIRLKAVFPPAGQCGQTLELKLTSGDDLEEVQTLHFTHPGITATATLQTVEGQTVPVENTFQVAIAADVPPGVYEVRAAGLFGVSNPLRFGVSARPQVLETEDNSTPDKAALVPLDCAIVGQLQTGTDVDCFRFEAQAGQRVVIDCLAERLDSPLQAELLLRDASGRRLRAITEQLGVDPVLVLDVPADGAYSVELHDRTYRSGVEYTYRLDLHTGPHVSFVMPPAGPAGTRSRFTAWGYNLPEGRLLDSTTWELLEVDIDVPREDAVHRLHNVLRSYEAGEDAFSWSLDSPPKRSNPVRIGISEVAPTLEVEPNDDPAQALLVNVPTEVAGQLAQPGDRDWVAFAAQPGQVYWIEVIGQRTGGTLDPVLIVDEVTTDAAGVEQIKRLTQQDDDGANVAQNVFDTFTDDPVYRLAVDKAATYRVGIYDRYGQTRGDPALRYRLCIHGEEPDFRVVAVPANRLNNTGVSAPITLRQGDSVSVDLYALRKFGCTSPIEVSVTGLPAGVTCAGATIGSKESAGVIVFRAEETAAKVVVPLQLIARAAIESPVSRRALDDAIRQLADAEQPLPDLRKKLEESRQKLQAGIKQRDAAALRANDDPAKDGLAQELRQRQQAVESQQSQFAVANDALAAGESAVAAARVALEKAEAAVQVTIWQRQHVVRAGTLVSGGQNNVPAEGRLAQSLTLAVVRESAPYELRADVQRVSVPQSRQLLVPIQLIRRGGFEDKVDLTVAGVPKNSNLQAPKVTIAKDSAEGLVSIFVKENTPPGTYALWIDASGQVSYSRNPEKTARLVAERDALAGQLQAAQAAAAAATGAKELAIRQAEDCSTALKQAQQTRQQAEQSHATRTQELAAVKPLLDTAEVRVNEANQAVTAAEAALEAAQTALSADAANAELQAAVTAAEALLQSAQQRGTEAAAAQMDLAKKLGEAEQLLNAALAGVKSATEAVPIAEQAQRAADAARAAAEAAEKSALAAVQVANERKQAADKLVETAQKASQPQNKAFTPTVGPIVFDVVPTPLKLSVSVPNGGTVKPGQSLELGIKLERLNRFTGPVGLALALPPNIQSLSGTATLSAEADEGKLMVTAASDAPAGSVELVVVRARVEHAGQVLEVDAPVTIKVVP